MEQSSVMESPTAMIFSRLVVLKFVRTNSPRAVNATHHANRQRSSRRPMRRPEQAGEAGVRGGDGVGGGPTARHADELGTGSTTLERFGLIMPLDSPKAGTVGNPELICPFCHTSPPHAVKPRAYLASTTSLEAGILWSAPAERSGDGALAAARHWPN